MKKCEKGKSCSATCISSGYKCRVELGSFEKEALAQAAMFLDSSNLAKLRDNIIKEAEDKKLKMTIAERGKEREQELRVEDFLSGRMFEDEEVKLTPDELQSRIDLIDRIRDSKGGEGAKIVGDRRIEIETIEDVIRTGQELGSGSFGTAFAKGDLVVKVGRLKQKEIDMGIVGSEMGLGPKIHALWAKGDLRADGNGVLVMERVKGLPIWEMDTARAKVPFGKLPEEVQDKAMISMIEGARKMHNQGVSHGDMNSGNIIITPSGRAVFVDWAFASRGRTENMVEDIADLSSNVQGLAYREEDNGGEVHPRVQRFLDKTEGMYEDLKADYSPSDIDSFYD